MHPYNRTWANERIVEIPIVRRFLEKHSPERVLEIGDVMNHYFPFPHDVLDKYTISRNVINKDVCEFDPSTRYDAIISISTLEHVGWDAPEVRDDTKIARAVAHLQSLLAPGGQLVFTVPTGYNTNLDSILTQNRLPLASEHYLERYSEKNEWRAASRDCALARRYGSPFPAANAILVATVC